jgi:methylglyoxal synthase
MKSYLYARPVMDQPFRNAAPGIALVAHDARRQELIECVRVNRGALSPHTLYTTGTMGALLAHEFDLRIHPLLHGPYGGYAQIGALVAERLVRCVIFFWDPLTYEPFDLDVTALLRLTVLHNVPTACNRLTADLLFSSPLFRQSLSKPETTDFLEVQRDCDLVSV